MQYPPWLVDKETVQRAAAPSSQRASLANICSERGIEVVATLNCGLPDPLAPTGPALVGDLSTSSKIIWIHCPVSPLTPRPFFCASRILSSTTVAGSHNTINERHMERHKPRARHRQLKQTAAALQRVPTVPRKDSLFSDQSGGVWGLGRVR